MIDDNSYCIDISNQLIATEAILRKTNKLIIESHLSGYVKEAFETLNEKEKIEEIMELFNKIAK